jgi:hypothetical protein
MRSIRPGRLERFRFLQLALFVLILLLVTAVFPNALLLRALLALAFLNTLFVTLSAVGHGPMLRRALFVAWLAGTALILSGGLQLFDRFDRIAILTGQGAYLLLMAAGIAATLRYVLTTRRVSLDMIFGAVVAYLLIGVGFAMFYTMLLTLDPQAFKLADPVKLGNDAALMPRMVYFSFVTIATLGYGDITPQTPFLQILAAFEAVIGQFYIAVVIAWLVSRYVMEPNPQQANDNLDREEKQA